MSLNTATKEQPKELIQYISDNICLPIIGVGGGDAPIGKMGMFDAIVAPQGWLIADGSEYNIDDYPELATHIASTHGSMYYYGGNGTTTFAVPDWQGEFFRASGTNSHTNQGDGANVGVHQDGTEIPQIVGGSGKIYISDTNSQNGIKKPDSMISNASYVGGASGTSGLASYAFNTTRPTNTSLLCCIKATPQGHQYSEKEQIVGTWIDGKPLYQKTFDFGSNINIDTSSWTVISSIDTSNIALIVDNTCTRADGVNYVICVSPLGNGNKLELKGCTTNPLIRYCTIRYTKTTD